MKNITADATGTYTLTIMEGNCSNNESITINNIGNPTANNAESESCDVNGMGQFDLTKATATVAGGQSGITVKYYTDSNATMLITDSTMYMSPDNGVVYARVKYDDTDCFAISQVTLKLTTLQAPTLTFSPSIDGGLCATRQVLTVSIDNPTTSYVYTWTGGANMDDKGNCVAFELTSTNNQLNLNYALGICDDDLSQQITWGNAPDPGTKILRIGQTNTLFCNRNDFVSYQWGRENKMTLCPEVLAGETYQNYVAQSIDETNYYYWVIVEDASGCTQKLYYGDDPFMKIIVDPIEYGELIIQVMPNPNDGTFQLELAGKDDKALDIHLYDALGREVYYRQLDKLQFVERVPVSLSQLNSGLYFVRVTGNKGLLLTEKIIINK